MSSSSTAPPPTSLFVGNLDPRVYRQLLAEIFALAGPVTQCHIVFDKTTGLSSGFGFVDYPDHPTAQAAMDKFRGRSIYGKLLTIDWARASATKDPTARLDESAAYCLFVGNLSPDVSDDQLLTAFQQFGSCVSAKCAKDPHSNKTQGFAFVSFQQRPHAAAAMSAMNGQVLNNRPLRVEWAKGKTNAATRAAALGLPDVALPASAPAPNALDDENQTPPAAEKPLLSFDTIAAQTSPNNITAYVAGLSVTTSEDKIRDRFARYGEIREIRIPDSVKAQATETMYAFVRYHEHESAARAIFECQQGTQVDGRTVQVHWGRESVRRTHPPVTARAPIPNYVAGYHHPQQQHSAQFQHHSYGRPAYTARPYPRAPGPGPMYHPPHVGAQQRYRPY